jgi:hypothetical protein
MINSNDIFIWGCADCDSFTLEQLENIINRVLVDHKWGVIHWLCATRNEQPQKPIKEQMQSENAWTDEMEGLPENRYWKGLREREEKGRD